MASCKKEGSKLETVRKWANDGAESKNKAAKSLTVLKCIDIFKVSMTCLLNANKIREDE